MQLIVKNKKEEMQNFGTSCSFESSGSKLKKVKGKMAGNNVHRARNY